MDERIAKALLYGKRRLDALAAQVPAAEKLQIEARLPAVNGPSELARLEQTVAGRQATGEAVEKTIGK